MPKAKKVDPNVVVLFKFLIRTCDRDQLDKTFSLIYNEVLTQQQRNSIGCDWKTVLANIKNNRDQKRITKFEKQKQNEY